MRISLISYTYNDAAYLRELFAHADRWGVPFDERLVVDDGSNPLLSQSACPGATILRTEANNGPAAAKRLGLGRASSDVLLSIDCDIRPHPKWLRYALTYLTDPTVGLVGTETILPTQSPSLAAAWLRLNAVRNAPRQGDAFNRSLCGGIVLLRQSAYAAVGGIDTSAAVAEDARLSNAIAASGATTVSIHRYPVYQARHLSIRQLCRQHVIYMGPSHRGLARDAGEARYIIGQLDVLSRQLGWVEEGKDRRVAVVPLLLALCIWEATRRAQVAAGRDEQCLCALLGACLDKIDANAPLGDLWRATAAGLWPDSQPGPYARNAGLLPESAAFQHVLRVIETLPTHDLLPAEDITANETFHYLDDKPLSYGIPGNR